jgi:hypothetical protein
VTDRSADACRRTTGDQAGQPASLAGGLDAGSESGLELVDPGLQADDLLAQPLDLVRSPRHTMNLRGLGLSPAMPRRLRGVALPPYIPAMGRLVTKPYDPVEGAEYADYLEHISREADRLRREGRLPDNETVMSFFDDVRGVVQQVRDDSSRATARGERQVVTTIQLSSADYRRIMSMSESMGTLLEILEMRQAVDMKRTEGTTRVATAVREGTFLDD